MRVFSINGKCKSPKPSFGSVIPIKIKLNDNFVENSFKNESLFKSICTKFCRGINNRNTSNDTYKKIKELFLKNDPDFKNEKISTIRGLGWGEKYIVSGIDSSNIRKFGNQIGWGENILSSKTYYRNEEKKLVKNPQKRIPNIESFIIDVISKENKKNEYEIIGGEFEQKQKENKFSNIKNSSPQLKNNQQKMEQLYFNF